MNTGHLPDVAEQDDLLLQLEQFKMGIISRATGKGYEDSEYKKIRKLILTNPNLEKLAPKFLKLCRSTDEFWTWIKEQAPDYATRRSILNDEINPLLEAVEYETGEAALEFSKNYEEKELLGQGGFGIVYKYEHRLLKLPFAVKIFAPSFYEGGSNEKELERFFQEARILFKLNHPNIIKIHDAGLIGKRPFIRMEYFKGKNLNDILMAHGPIESNKAITVIKSIASAIQHAHEIGVIHRDLKPSNIMAAPPNQFRVIDFGLGIFIENELHSRLTKTGSQTISGYYNAPELVATPTLIDKRSDIYSIGAIWFTVLTGQPPAGSDFMSILTTLNIEEKTIKTIQKCLSPLHSRYSDCGDLLNDIDEIISGINI